MAHEFPSLQALLQQYKLSHTVFVGGKGGVGKTSTAASLAIGLARSGRCCLLVSTDPAHSLLDVLKRKARIWERSPPPKKTSQNIEPNLDLIELDSETLAHQYLQRIKIHVAQFLSPKLLQRMERQIELAALAPGTLEAALTEKIAQLVSCEENAKYQHIIFDTAPSGHTLRLLQTPKVFSGWVDGLLAARARSHNLAEVAESLRISEQPDAVKPQNTNLEKTRRFRAFAAPESPQKIERERKVVEVLEERRRLLGDLCSTLRQSHFLLVLNAEALPLQESLRLYESLKQMRIPVLALVINRILPQISAKYQDTIESPKIEKTSLKAFFAQQKQQENKYLAEISQKFSKTLPRVFQPFYQAPQNSKEESNGFLQGPEALWRLFCG